MESGVRGGGGVIGRQELPAFSICCVVAPAAVFEKWKGRRECTWEAPAKAIVRDEGPVRGEGF